MENTFQRFRRFVPKESLLQNYSDQEIADICDIMNNTPRKCLGWRTPKEVFEGQSVKPTTAYQIIKNIIIQCCS
jgi:IS30 family transposase